MVKTSSSLDELIRATIGASQASVGLLALADMIRKGVPTAAVEAMVATGDISLAEIDRIVLPRKTFAHRKEIGKLTADQSDRVVRVARIIAMAEDTFADRDTARRWLRRPTTALKDESPMDLLDTEQGARVVETLLGRIAHGIAA